MGKTRDHFKNIRDIKGIFHAKMGTIKGRSCMDLAEARWQELRRGGKNTQKDCTKKGVNDLDNHDIVVTLLKIDTMECVVKWA